LSRSSPSITAVAWYASRPVTFSNFHKAAAVNEFAIASSNLDAVFTPKLVALGSALLGSFDELFQGQICCGARFTPESEHPSARLEW
jgi:hypothetical protein